MSKTSDSWLKQIIFEKYISLTNQRTFQRNITPPFSELKHKPEKRIAINRQN
jgi:hypothetical protein